MANDLRRGRRRHLYQILQRDHGAAIGAHIEAANVAGLRAIALVGLHVYAVRAVVEIEVVDVTGAHVNFQRVSDLVQRNIKALGFFAVNAHHKLRVIGGKAAE